MDQERSTTATRRRVVRAAATLAGAALAACGGRTEPAASPVKSPVKLTYVLHNANKAGVDQQHFAAEYKEKHPNVDAEWVMTNTIQTAGPVETKVIALIVGGTPPDLFNVDMGPGTVFLARGMAAPIDPGAMGFKSVGQVQEQYAWPEILDMARWKGKYHGLPTEFNTNATFVNNRMFRKAGLDPEKDWPKTWEQLVEVARKLTVREGSEIKQRGYRLKGESGADILINWGGQTYQLAGSYIAADGKPAITTPGAQQSLQYWIDWVYQQQLGAPSDPDGFVNETQAMATYGPWFTSSIRKNNPTLFADYSVRPLPRWANRKYDHGTYNYGWATLVSSGVSPDNQAEAWRLLWFLSGFPADQLRAGGLLQPLKAFVNSPEFKGFPDMPHLSVFVDEMKKSTYTPQSPAFADIQKAFGELVPKAWKEGQGAKQVLTDLQNRLADATAQAGA